MSLDKRAWIVEATIADMQHAMEEGWMSSVELVQLYLERIGLYDGWLRSILEVNPDALQIAKELDQERRNLGARGRLHGIPILLKDNIDTGDRLHTSAGSITLADSYAAKDSFVAAKLREAGAVILGKSNMTEWANFMSSTMWAGYSSRRGLTLNPYGPGEMFVGGSSSGSGAAVAANLAAAAIGTETSGSIISPSSQNSLVGLKPTIGLISRTGIIPITHTQDTAGPMTRTVEDAAILLSAIAGADDLDEVTKTAAQARIEDYTKFLDASYLKRSRIGIPRYYYKHLDRDRLDIVESAIDVLREQGATIIDPVELPCQGTRWDANVLRYEFKKYVNDYLANVDPSLPVHSLAEVIAYNEARADIALKYGQNTLIWAEETSGTLTEKEYLESRRRNKERAGAMGIDHVLREHQLDALLFLGNEYGPDLAARAGYPSLTVPGGYAEHGIIAPGGYNTKGPQGITFIGTAYSEPVLIQLAYGFEQATKHRVPPKLSSQSSE
ncbi:amidase family protein [Paenibacillus lautus]|jgi:amidase|uniref:amidase family protein n=1 Tax=Paenibacillus lautus TaxID=1401 RepID=UPI0026EB4DE3|nr:amidase family protein [Paenibacillus lautus]MBY0161299.1 amidase [Cytobacillus firmus]MCI1777100.1 amidase family protein [Paenibacillus lautus]